MAKKQKWAKPTLVECEWWDAWSDLEKDGTVASIMAEHAYLLKRFTLGYLVGQTDIVVVLAHDFDPPLEDDGVPRLSHLTVIPTGWIRNIRVVVGKGNKHGKLQSVGASGAGTGAPKVGAPEPSDKRVQPEPEDSAAGEQAKRDSQNSKAKEDH